jgi:uncharacterized protein (DUF1697 family)
MIIYIALLRGINVGGKNIIKMAELKKVFEDIGFYDVKTYIQSGNVLFKSSEDEESIKKKVEYKIEEVFGLSVKVILRTSQELEQIILNCPFSKEEVDEAEYMSKAKSLYVALLAHTLSKENIDYLNSYKSESDDCIIVGREVYLLFRNSIRNSKLYNNIHKLDVPATTRNWNTINKLDALAKGIHITK